MYIKNLNFLAQFGGKIGEEQNFFNTTFDFLSIDLKRGKFFIFDTSTSPPQNLGISEF